ncbi:J domain-containing protein [Rhodoflexus caldus]|uniref:J domain-containing protein n=1 Tax=Rhodoflexus caldus TaxID=2891236 RepID=UPI00202A7EEA|nr:J domain-containing protein [Rhodoflexus caldus]
MFDRIFKIIRANIGDALSQEPQMDSLERELYRQYQEQMRKAAAEPAYEQTPPPPAYSAEELGYYQALEVQPGATFEQIKAAYKLMVKKYHPDRFPNEPDKQKTAIQITQRINIAYSYFEKKFGK